MGFIERLRQQKEAEALARAQRDSELSRERKAEETKRQQREAEENELHRQRRQQAENFRTESGIGNFVGELRKIFPTWMFASEEMRSSAAPIIPLKDQDSVVDKHAWGLRGDPHPERGYGGQIESYLVVETTPDGTTFFYYGKQAKSLFGSVANETVDNYSIPKEVWRARKEILEETLEKAFNQPIHIKYRYKAFPPEERYSVG